MNKALIERLTSEVLQGKHKSRLYKSEGNQEVILPSVKEEI